MSLQAAGLDYEHTAWHNSIEEGEAFLWDELLEQAREDGPVLSFFIVNETVDRHSEPVRVSGLAKRRGVRERTLVW